MTIELGKEDLMIIQIALFRSIDYFDNDVYISEEQRQTRKARAIELLYRIRKHLEVLDKP